MEEGTSHFAACGFDELATEAGLWWAWGTEGGPTWDATHEVGAPDGRYWCFSGEYRQASISAQDFEEIKAQVDNDPAAVVAEIQERLADASMSLAQRIEAESCESA